jgi:hypothetical protein
VLGTAVLGIAVLGIAVGTAVMGTAVVGGAVVTSKQCCVGGAARRSPARPEEPTQKHSARPVQNDCVTTYGHLRWHSPPLISHCDAALHAVEVSG